VAVTDRATQAEKAQAWDRLMKSTKTDPLALMDAWEWLEQQVKEREERAREAGLEILLPTTGEGGEVVWMSAVKPAVGVKAGNPEDGIAEYGARHRSRANGHFPGDAA
jgi:hypothetical protein